VLKQECVSVIMKDFIEVIPLDRDEKDQVFKTTRIHNSERICNCCDKDQKELTDGLIKEHLG